MNITVFGTCRLDSLNSYNNRIKHEISYTYDTKEILEVIKFIKYNHISPEETITTFRTPMMTKQPIYSSNFKDIFKNTDIFIIEICGKKTYTYNNFYVHSALSHFSNNLISQQIVIREQDSKEIEDDILQIINELNTRRIIIVSHIVTDDTSERFKLAKILEHVCLKYKLTFINPAVEVFNMGYNIHDLVVSGEKKILHYNDNGHRIMKEIYERFILLMGELAA